MLAWVRSVCRAWAAPKEHVEEGRWLGDARKRIAGAIVRERVGIQQRPDAAFCRANERLKSGLAAEMFRDDLIGRNSVEGAGVVPEPAGEEDARGAMTPGNTDDLRKSPLVEVIETLLGKGFQVKIYDKNVATSRLIGANKRFIEEHIPHLSSLLVDQAGDLVDAAQVVVVGYASAEFLPALKHAGGPAHY